MLTTQVQTRLICPAELDQPTPAAPAPAADAQITMNASGQAYLTGLVSWGLSLAKLFGDAASACHTQTQGAAP